MRISIAFIVGVCAVVSSATAQSTRRSPAASGRDTTVLPDSTAKRLQHTIDSLTAMLRAIQARVDSLAMARATESMATPQPVTQPRTPGAYMNVSFVGLTDVGWASTPNVR